MDAPLGVDVSIFDTLQKEMHELCAPSDEYEVKKKSRATAPFSLAGNAKPEGSAALRPGLF